MQIIPCFPSLIFTLNQIFLIGISVDFMLDVDYNQKYKSFWRSKIFQFSASVAALTEELRHPFEKKNSSLLNLKLIVY